MQILEESWKSAQLKHFPTRLYTGIGKQPQNRLRIAKGGLKFGTRFPDRDMQVQY